MFKYIIIIAVIIAVVCAKPKWNQLNGYTFKQYKADFKKQYSSYDEEVMRREIFQNKLKEVTEFNAIHHSWRKGINHLSDWTNDELKSLRGARPRAPLSKKLKIPSYTYTPSGMPIPQSVDYRKVYPSVLTAVKDQGQCGSCWAHAATEQMETYLAIKTGKLYVLSQQQLTSCVENDNQCGGSGGCGGGTVEISFNYAHQHPLTEEWIYSYQSYNGVTPACALTPQMNGFAQPIGYTILPRNDPFIVMDALAHVGPLAISVDASEWSDYESGIYDGCNYAANISMDHAVQLVGYGHDSELGEDYWLVRNSWNAGFGEDGYIRLIKNKRRECGWDNQWVLQGGGCKGQANTVYSCGQCGLLYDVVYPHF